MFHSIKRFSTSEGEKFSIYFLEMSSQNVILWRGACQHILLICWITTLSSLGVASLEILMFLMQIQFSFFASAWIEKRNQQSFKTKHDSNLIPSNSTSRSIPSNSTHPKTFPTCNFAPSGRYSCVVLVAPEASWWLRENICFYKKKGWTRGNEEISIWIPFLSTFAPLKHLKHT